MMVLVRRSLSIDPDGLFIGVFSAYDRISLYIAIDEFCDPHGCEFFVVDSGYGFLLNDFTSKQYKEWYAKGCDNDPPNVQIDDVSGGLFSEKLFNDNSLWHPVIEPNENNNFSSWVYGVTEMTDDQEFNLCIE